MILPEYISVCCGAPVKIEGDVLRLTRCTSCMAPCDVEADHGNPQIKEANELLKQSAPFVGEAKQKGYTSQRVDWLHRYEKYKKQYKIINHE